VIHELGLDPQRFYAGGYPLPDVKGGRKLAPGTVLKAVGCAECNQLGYSGRTGIYEMLMVDDPVRQLTLQKADAATIRRSAVERGMVTLRLDGARKCMLGLTTPEEVLMTTAEADR
jgi:general secretion pathway protein E